MYACCQKYVICRQIKLQEEKFMAKEAEIHWKTSEISFKCGENWLFVIHWYNVANCREKTYDRIFIALVYHDSFKIQVHIIQSI